jgi:hypothetical protein
MNRSSGDTIRIEFDRGDVRRIAVLGPRSRLEGDYFPEPMITGRETQFRLVGFRWFERDRYAVSLNGAIPDSPDSLPVKLPAGANFGEE